MITNNPMMIQLIYAGVFFAILIGLLAIFQAVKGAQHRRNVLQKIKNSRDAWEPTVFQVEDEAYRSPTDKIFKLVAGIGARISNERSSSYSNLRLRLLRAGQRRPDAVRIYWGAKAITPLLLVLSFAVTRMAWSQVKLLTTPQTLAVTIAAGLLGFYLPELWLALKTSIRKTKMTEDLPDALDLLVVCVEAGLGLDGAFNRVAEEMNVTSPELSEEFKFMNLELRAGKARQEALRDLSTRADIKSVQSLVTLLIHTEMFGTGIAKALRVFASSFRTKRFQKAEEIAAKLPVKMLIPMVFFIFPMFMAVMVGPACISIWENWLAK